MLPIGVGTVLAAGVVTVLNRRRRDQQRTRRPGQRLPAPAAPDQQLERALRAGENPLDDVAAALRGLAGHFHGATLPTVRAGRVTPTHLDLYLETPATLPQPWIGAGDTTVWTIPLAAIQSPEDPAPAASAAPWPTLVTIGRDDEDGYVLLDLETLAALTVVTPGAHATRAVEILTALAVDLATSRWADDLRVTIVGACADLEDALQTGRIRYVPTAARVLDELEQRAGADQAALAAAGMSSLQQARAHALAPDAWIPDILITTTPLTDTQQQRLTRLLQSSPRTAIAAVTKVDIIQGRVTGPAQDRDTFRAPDTTVVKTYDVSGRDVVELRYDLGIVGDTGFYVRLRGSDGNRSQVGYFGAATDSEGPAIDVVGDADPWLDLWFYTNPIFVLPRS